MPDQHSVTDRPYTMPSFASDLLMAFGRQTALRAGPATGTAAAPRQSAPARPAFVNDEADIRRGHKQRRELLARRRAEQQVAILMLDYQARGLTLPVGRITAVAIDTYRACMAVARR